MNVREMYFCEKHLADIEFSWVFQKYFNFLPTLQFTNVSQMKDNFSCDVFCEKIQADITVSWVFQNYLNFLPTLQFTNVSEMKGNDR